MRVQWDPQPTFVGLPAYRLDATPAEQEAFDQHMWQAYERYAASLDQDYPMWAYEILTINHPAHELVVIAQQRRDQDGGQQT